MKTEKLTRDERKTLKRQQRPAVLLATSLFIIITGVNLVIHFHDVVTGIEGLARPPISQLIIIEVIAFLLAITTFYFLSKKLLKDLSTNMKQIEHIPVVFKYLKKNDGKLQYLLKLKNNFEIDVNSQLYNTVGIGDLVEVCYAKESAHVFNIGRLLNIT